MSSTSEIGPLLHEVNVLFSRLTSADMTKDDLAMLDKQLDAHRSGADARYRYVVEQLGSYNMLPMIDLACGSGCSDLRRKHVERLLDSHYPDARILEREIDRAGFRGSQRDAAPVTARRNAEVWIARQNHSSKAGQPCNSDVELCESMDEARQSTFTQIVEASKRLR
jgi:hypothetical protein